MVNRFPHYSGNIFVRAVTEKLVDAGVTQAVPLCPMNLETYCLSKGGTGTRKCKVLARLADKTGYNLVTLYMVCKGNKVPGPMMANALHKATRGQVSRVELRQDVFDISRQTIPS